jgi:GT2 family glycosyltransferase
MTVVVLAVVEDDSDAALDAIADMGLDAVEIDPLGDMGHPATGTAFVLTHSSLGAAQVRLTARGGVSNACAAAIWERATRQALDRLRGHPALILPAGSPPGPGLAELLGRKGGRRRHPTSPALADGPSALGPSAAQLALGDLVDTVLGAHASFDPPPLPAETATTEALVGQWRAGRGEQDRLEATLSVVTSGFRGLSRAKRGVSRHLPEQPYALDAAQDIPTYRLWLDLRGPKRARRLQELRDARLADRGGPTISVLVPVYEPDVQLLERCVESVRSNVYPNWQLCLCDDGSADAALDRLLDGLASDDPRIEVVRRSENGGISAATNAAAERAVGEFLAFVDQDDELAPEALAEVAEAVLSHPDADVVYTDEDKLDPAGQRLEPYFKPDWNPDLLLSNMYLGHLLVVRRSLFEEVGGLRTAFDGSQDYDLALRVTERARRVVHVPTVAYHWRKTEGSTAARYGAKPYADVAARNALADTMKRRGEEAEILPGAHESTFRVRRALRGRPLVSIVIPYHDGADLLRKCVDSLHATAGYDNWEAMLVDNNSWQPETAALRLRLETDTRCRLLTYGAPFNWSAINNWAAEHCQGDLLLFLNSDIEGKAEGWLSAMVEHAQRPEVGAVGARLLYPNGTVQHAGVVMGLGGGVAWHPFCFCPPGHGGYFGNALAIRNWTAVTGACLLARRDVWEEVGRFDEGFSTAFNDVDFCLRVRERGYLVVYTPFAELYHYEGATRGVAAQETAETGEMFRRWEGEIRHDPYFNPNLDPMRNEFALYVGAEEVDPWENVLSAVAKLSSGSGRG